MSPGLDRRLQRHLAAFCVVDKLYYEDLGCYTASSTEYLDELTQHVTVAHHIEKQGIWYHVRSCLHQVPLQGFKIHLSATCASANRLLQVAVPILVNADVAFKVVVDPFILSFINGKNYPRPASGKFITAYPREEQFADLCEKLHRATSDMAGPYILSDRRYSDSRVVFYRYGGFLKSDCLTIHGDRTPMITRPDGVSVPDVRGPFFSLPEGVQDPFQRTTPKDGGSNCLRERFSIESALSFSNAGGVYKARDSVTGQSLIVKEARPFVGTTAVGDQDAIAVLRKEHRVLRALEDTGFVPRVVDYFQEWEHEFLVEEFVSGISLSSYRAGDEVGLLVNRHRTGDSAAFCSRLFHIAATLLEIIRQCHARGVLLGDLSPNNILIDPDTMQLWLIDMEGAHFTADASDKEIPIFTPGFISRSRLAGAPLSPGDDYYALGCALYSVILPVQAHFRLSPESSPMILSEITRDYGLPTAVPELILSLMDGNPERAEDLVKEFINGGCICPVRHTPAPTGHNKTPHGDLKLQQLLDGISSHILAEAGRQRRDRLWPGDYRLSTTNPLGLAYGAIGIARYLSGQHGELPRSIVDWILAQPVDCSSYPPGLYVGLAGIAWGLAELGMEDRAVAAMKLTYRSPLLFEGPDVFYGMAGTGLASLYFWQRTGNQVFLDLAVQLGEALLAKAEPEDLGYSWLNTDGQQHCGFAFGGSGIALFLLYLSIATGEDRLLSHATGALDVELAQAVEKDECVSWPRSKGDRVLTPYWQAGSAGIGSVLVRFGALLGQERYTELARKAARYAASKYAVLPGQFLGLSGIGEFLLDMYTFTQEQSFLDDARRAASGIRLFQIATPSGIMFPGEELLRASLDYGTGSAGVGMYLRRLARPGPRPFYDFMRFAREPVTALPSGPAH